MQTLAQMQYDIEMLKTRVDNMIRPATVTKIYEKPLGFVDVISGELPLEQIPVYTSHNEKDITQWLPTEGEDGTIFSAGGDLANAFFTSTIPTKKQNIEKIGEGDPLKTIGIKLRKDSELILEQGKNRILIKDGELIIQNDQNTFVMDSSGIKSTVNSLPFRIWKKITNTFFNILGAKFFPIGTSNLQCAVGPIFFPPEPEPGGPPVSAGNDLITEVPAIEIDDVKVLQSLTKNKDSNLEMDWDNESMNLGLITLTIQPVPTGATPGFNLIAPTGGGPVTGTIVLPTNIRLSGNPNVKVEGQLDLEFQPRPLN